MKKKKKLFDFGKYSSKDYLNQISLISNKEDMIKATYFYDFDFFKELFEKEGYRDCYVIAEELIKQAKRFGVIYPDIWDTIVHNQKRAIDMFKMSD